MEIPNLLQVHSARFLWRQVHLFKETECNHGRTYCGLSERGEIWTDRDSDVTCQFCKHYSKDQHHDE